MSDLLSIFGSDIFPIFAIAGAGYLLARYLGANVQTVAHVVFYAALPCLAFELLVDAPRGTPHLGRLVLMGVAMTGVMCLVGYLVGTALRLTRPDLRAFMLVVMFSNAGNFGLPVLQIRVRHRSADLWCGFLPDRVGTHVHAGRLSCGGRSTAPAAGRPQRAEDAYALRSAPRLGGDRIGRVSADAGDANRRAPR